MQIFFLVLSAIFLQFEQSIVFERNKSNISNILQLHPSIHIYVLNDKILEF